MHMGINNLKKQLFYAKRFSSKNGHGRLNYKGKKLQITEIL
jgi:hypothetical protein